MMHDLVEHEVQSVARHAARPLFGEKQENGWTWMTYAQWHAHVEATRAGLGSLGIGPGDRVAIISRNSAAWAAAAYATFGLGATFVPMYESQRRTDWEHILRDSGAKVVLVRTPEIAVVVDELARKLPALADVIVIEAPTLDPRSLALLEQYGEAHPVARHTPAPDDIAELVYTSGTTGLPKGVMLSHANLTSNVEATSRQFPLEPGERTVSFLPWAHVYGQVCEVHILIGIGASTAFNTNIEHLAEDLREVKPTLLFAVPRVFNKIYRGITAQMAEKPWPVRRLFWAGLRASIRKRKGERLALRERVLLWLAGVLFAVIRKKFGGRLEYAISGSASLSHEVAEFIDALGIEVYEGYGLTEASPIVTMNSPGRRKLGSVGVPIDGVSIEIDRQRGDGAGDGEIIVHGPNVMRGYHARPDENARAFTADGGLRTGDIGHVDRDGYLFITGRLKEQYKLENGKYVMPGPVEERLALSPFIRNVMLYGDGRPYNVALVAIDPDRVAAWAAEQGLHLGDDAASDPRVRTLILEELERNGGELRAYERPRKCVLTAMPMTVENGLVTPTLKVKRRDVIARFGAQLDALYAEDVGIIAPPGQAPRPEAHV